ncbi:MAG: T9SS type A sorting domain-containing protein [Cytophagaceae bacterium]|nr:MAG: T9SS type A sorting domain-containing protein [Cytophagaceae bacterium]
MKQPFTVSLKWLLLALVLGTGYPSRGQATYRAVPLTASSFTADVVANGTAALPAASSTTADADGAGYYLISQDYYTATTAHTSGIPNSGLIPNSVSGYSALTYQLASLSANNSLRLAGASSGTVTFATPTAAAEVYVLACSGSGAATATITVTYSDGTTTAFAGQNYPDWYGVAATQNVFGMTGRASTSTTASPISTPYAAAGTAPFLDQVRLAIPANKVTSAISSLTVANTTAGAVLNILAVSIGTYPVCSAMPTGLQAAATTTSGGTTALATACTSTSIYLSATGLPANTAGYTYQWQASTTSATTGFAPIAGATSSTYTATGQAATTWYRLVVACLYDGAGGTAVNSAAVQVTQNPATSCYCVPTHSSTSTSYATITSVSLPGDAGTLTSAPGLLTSASPGYVAPYYAVYPASSTTTTLSVNAPYTLSVAVPAFTRASAWIDFDQSGTFDANEFFILYTGTAVYASSAGTLAATITPPATALPGTTRLRIRTDYYGNTVLNTSAGACSATTYGEAVDYSLTIAPPVPCAGTPAATTATASATGVCAATGFTLSITGIAPGTTGLSYQWQSRTGTNAFANLGAAQTSAAYPVAGITATTDYRVVITCTASGASTASSVVSVAFNFLTCYCTPVSTGTNEYIKSVTLPGTPGFTNTSNANSTTGYGDFTTNAALTTTLTQGSTYPNGISVIGHLNSTNAQVGLWIDYDHSGTFDASEYLLVGTQTLINADYTFAATLTVPATALLGQTRVRVRQRNGAFSGTDACTTGTTTWYGETEDYFITIAAPTTCAAPPATVAATADVTNACANASFTLATSSVPTTLGGYGYQWQSRTGTNAFANIAGATTNPYVVLSQTAATDYRLVVSCQYGGTPATSNTVSVGQNSVNQCYCPASSTNVCSNYGVITSVALGTLTNPSGCASTSSYSDYSALSTSLGAGTTATLTLGVSSATSTYNYNYGVWIDFNQNGTFEAAEFVANSTAAVSATSVAISIPIPAFSSAVLAGPTRLRIRTNAGLATYGIFTATGANSACGAVYNGETEDYTVNLVSCTSTATFSYPAGPYCVSGTTSPAPTITGTAGGTFSSTTGLSLNATTGAITLSSSTPGSYTVTYAVTGPCPVSSTQSVTISAAPTAGFSYPTTTACAGTAATRTPTLAAGAAAGTYTLPTATGLSINATTGVVTIGAAAQAGTYVVTNTLAASGGCAAVASTATLTIAAAPATPTLTTTGTPATGITLTSSAATGNQFYRNGVAISGATGQTYLVNSGSQNGAYTVTVTNAAGCSVTSAAVAVTVTAATPTAAATSLTVYPTPTRDGLLTLALSGYREAVQVAVLNTLGQRVYETTVSGTALTQYQTLNLSGLATGVYLLQARTASGGLELRRIVRE